MLYSIKSSTPSLLLIICLVGLPQISETIYTPSLPDIVASLSTTMNMVEWTLTTYFIGFALGVLSWGKWSDHIGRRKAMLFGLMVYIAGSIGCATAPSISILLTGRLFQAFGVSVGSVITMTIMRDVFSGPRRNQIFSVVAMALALAPALGPFIGGAVVQWFHWQANFMVLTMMGFGLLIYSMLRLPETHPNLGNKIHNYKLIDISKRLLTDKKVLACVLLVGGFNGIVFSYYAEAPYLFINLLKYSPSHYGMLGIFIGLASLLGALISHRLNHYLKSDQIIILGCFVTFICFAFLFINVMTGIVDNKNTIISSIFLLSPMLIFCIGFGITIPNVLSIALSHYQEVVGTAGSIFGFMYYILVAFILYGMGLLHNGTFLSMPSYFLGIATVMLITSILTFKKVHIIQTKHS